MSSTGDYKLAASLSGHEDDVRAVAFPTSHAVFSASRDATVRLWKLVTPSPPTFDGTLSSHGTAFVNALAYVQPSSSYPDGLIVSGGKDTIIEVRQPGKAPEENAEGLLLGHAGNVCALDASEDGKTIVSGSWDTSARVWELGKWEKSTVLEGHEASVWTVLAYDRETIITDVRGRPNEILICVLGCADKLIRVFHPSGKRIRIINGSSDVVRALCKLSSNNPSGAQFASAGNDAVVRLWTLDGTEVAQLHGHENFIYSLACLPNGDLVSSSEDRTVRVWRGDQSIQTITHPAISVWSVAACKSNGDIVTGASDRIVRVFSRDPERQGEPATIQAFEDSVKASSIPQQALGDGAVNKEQLPGPDFIAQKSGTKEGQVQMIKELNGNVSGEPTIVRSVVTESGERAPQFFCFHHDLLVYDTQSYSWSTAANQWLLVGTVVDAAGSSGRKVQYQGKDYDYVFDVDIEDGKPPLKLPFNVSQNPYEAASKFIADNELPVTYLEQVANFIVTNTQGATLGAAAGPQAQAPGSDPWGSESRYRPGEVNAPAPPVAASRPRALPQTQYLSIASAALDKVQKKAEENNQILVNSGAKGLSLNPSDLNVLSALVKQLSLAQAISYAPKPHAALDNGIDLVLRLATAWPVELRLPGLDLLRLLAAASPNLITRTSSGADDIVDVLASSGVFDSAHDRPNNTMLAVRCLANLFMTDEGRLITDGEFDKIVGLMHPFLQSTNRNVAVAIATLYINYAVMLEKGEKGAEGIQTTIRGLRLLQDLTGLLQRAEDSEVIYRSLVAMGTLVTIGADFRHHVKNEVPGFEAALRAASGKKSAGEPRIKNVLDEIKDEMS
ncbi:WD40-repeat-containing domain protein [Cryomyces antarcticus]